MKTNVTEARSQFNVKTGIIGGVALGDAVADITYITGIDKLAESYTNVTGRDCGCERRRQTLNMIAPEIFPWRRMA